MIRFLTAGESHGKGFIIIVEGFPSNLRLNESYVNFQLSRRQTGYGRGQRMKIEKDMIEFFSGVRYGKSLGSPISMIIRNQDWKSWQDVMAIEERDSVSDKITIPRPGHADLVGTIKYNYDDIRNSIERSSARETAARVAACSIARKFLEEFGIFIGSFVESIGGIFPSKHSKTYTNKEKTLSLKNYQKINLTADKSCVRVLCPKQEKKIIQKIELAKRKGDTLGGTFIVFAVGVPPGLGSFIQYDKKLDADLAHAVMSINAIKAIEIGGGFVSSSRFGSQVHDEIVFKSGEFSRSSNYAGGIEGGISNGLPIIVRAGMKPISTLMKPLMSLDLRNQKKVKSRIERSDYVAVPSASVIAEGMVSWVIANHFLRKYGGDSIQETRNNYNNYKKNLFKNIKMNYKG
jgi:chorismate synthase